MITTIGYLVSALRKLEIITNDHVKWLRKLDKMDLERQLHRTFGFTFTDNGKVDHALLRLIMSDGTELVADISFLPRTGRQVGERTIVAFSQCNDKHTINGPRGNAKGET
jgi:hypothetical protein